MNGRNGKNGLDTAVKQPNPVRGNKPFRKGDPRINRKGRPQNFDHFRALALAIAGEPVTVDGKRMSRAEALLREWMTSKEPQLQKAFAEYGFGKVPDKLVASGLEDKILILHFDHERQKNNSRFSPESASGAN